MVRISLIILGILVAVMGILAVIPGISMGSEPLWHSIVKIIVGAVAVIIGVVKKA
jgi:hypothetical protein